MVVTRTDYTQSSFSGFTARRTADDRLLIMSDGHVHQEFRADQWRDIWVDHGDGTVPELWSNNARPEMAKATL